MPNFVDIPIETDEATLVDAAIDRLSEQWPNWEPNEGDLEVVQIEAIAPLAANAARVAAQVPSTAVRTIGTTLFGIAYDDGVPATGLIDLTLTDTAGHTIDAGTEFDVDGVAFATDADTVVAPTFSSALNVPITCTVDGVVGNDLQGDSVVPISSVPYVDT